MKTRFSNPEGLTQFASPSEGIRCRGGVISDAREQTGAWTNNHYRI